MQSITTIGLDIAKSVFQVHGVDADGRGCRSSAVEASLGAGVLRRSCRHAWSASRPARSSHHWSRELKTLGHTVRLMPPAYVKPYVKRQQERCR